MNADMWHHSFSTKERQIDRQSVRMSERERRYVVNTRFSDNQEKNVRRSINMTFEKELLHCHAIVPMK
jgi:hypothetical protein